MILILLFLPFSALAEPFSSGDPVVGDLYKKGVEMAQNGDAEAAAALWIDYADSLNRPDFVLGHDFIRLVTENRLRNHYEKASELYFWGLSTTKIEEEEKKRLHEELFFIDPMLGQRERRRLERMIDDGNPEIYSFLRAFWQERARLPGDPYNERLLEHFERVHHAIQHFQTTSGSLFDDRGKTWIRFGEPFRKRSGVFMFNPGFVNYLITSRIDDGGAPGSGAFESAVGSAVYMNTYYRVRDYHTYPSFEVWVYEEMSEGRDNVIYIFGNRYGGADMNLMRSVDDFIPSAAFSMTDRNSPVTFAIFSENAGAAAEAGGGQDVDRTNIFQELQQGGSSRVEIITPALILQMMYYRQLASLDFYFGNQYEEMMDRYMNTSIPLSRSLSRQFQQTNSARLLEAQGQAPEERSAAESLLFDIAPAAHPYLFYDDELNPYLRIFFEEEFESAIAYEELRKDDNVDAIRYEEYELTRTILLRNHEGEQTGVIRTSTPVLADPDAEAIEQHMIRVPFQNEMNQFEITSELHNVSGAEGISSHSTLRASLKGFGRQPARELSSPETKTGFFISDVIFGYHDPAAENVDQFQISHSGEVKKGQGIMFYYEAYNIPQDIEGLYSFTLTYRILRERSALGRLFGSRYTGETSMSIENSSGIPRFSQLLEIISDELQPGNYQLELTVSADENTPEIHRSSHQFTIK